MPISGGEWGSSGRRSTGSTSTTASTSSGSNSVKDSSLVGTTYIDRQFGRKSTSLISLPDKGEKADKVESTHSSPRCIMEQQQQQQEDGASLSSVAGISPVVLEKRYDRYMVRKAKLFLLKSKYRDSLRIGHEFLMQKLHDEWSGPLSYFQATIRLSTPLQISCPSDSLLTSDLTLSSSSTEERKLLFFQIRLGTQLTAVDEMATIVLQSWYELAQLDEKQDENWKIAWKYLQPLLKIYSMHPMPVEFFVQIWIPFWNDSNSSSSSSSSSSLFDFGSSLALAWSIQVAVFLKEQCIRIEHSPVLLQELRDTLVKQLFTEQLPRITSPQLAGQMAQSILGHETWEPLILQIDDHFARKGDGDQHQHGYHYSQNITTLQILRATLEDYINGHKQNEDSRMIPIRLVEKILRHSCFLQLSMDKSCQGNANTLSIRAGHSLQDVKIEPWKKIHKNVLSLLPQSAKLLLERIMTITRDILCFRRSILQSRNQISNTANVIASSSTNETLSSNWSQLRLRTTLSIMSLLLAWRHRGILYQTSRVVFLKLLSPIIDLIDALKKENGMI